VWLEHLLSGAVLKAKDYLKKGQAKPFEKAA
jgi:hypothetical protein